MLDKVFILLSELNNTLPQFHEEREFIPRLHLPLQNLYGDYIDYCITIIRYLHKKSSSEFSSMLLSLTKLIFFEVGMLRSFWISNPRQGLRMTKASLKKHVQDFIKEAAIFPAKSARQRGNEQAKDSPPPEYRTNDNASPTGGGQGSQRWTCSTCSSRNAATHSTCCACCASRASRH